MRLTRLLSLCCLGGMLALPVVTSAQDTVNSGVPAGAPAPGTSVQLRYTSPGQLNGSSGAATSQQPTSISGSGVNPYAEIAARRGAAAGVEGAEGAEGEESGMREPFMSELVTGVGFADSSGNLILPGSAIYRGIIPSTHDTLPHIERYRRAAQASRRSNSLTWLGFQPFDEFTRVFIQTGRAAQPQLVTSPDGLTLTIRLPNTALSLSNFRRALETAWFGTAVSRVTTQRGPSGATDVVIELARDVRYEMTNSTSGAEYVFVDFYDQP